MKRIFFLSLAMLLCAAGLSIAATRLFPVETPKADAETVIHVLTDGEVQETAMADYLVGVVAAEMPASFEPEALKAQAVAARTYILDHAAHPPEAHRNAAVCADPGCCCAHITEEEMRENWGGDYRKNLRRIRDAVRETDGQRLTYAGEPIRAVFHSSSGGQTEASAALWGAVPYLVSVPSPETAQTVPGFETTVTVSASDAAQALGVALPEDPAQWLGETVRDGADRVETITIGGKALTGAEARRLFSLRSTNFIAEIADGNLVFHVIGSGHGVGMSQYGANVMAQQGALYSEILAHYYPGTVLEPDGANSPE